MTLPIDDTIVTYRDASSTEYAPAQRVRAAQAEVDALDAAVRPLLA